MGIFEFLINDRKVPSDEKHWVVPFTREQIRKAWNNLPEMARMERNKQKQITMQEQPTEVQRIAKSNLESEILMQKMKSFAKRYKARHPNTKPDRLKRIVCKKFNVKIT
jgi:hypothetical protein